MIYSAGLIAHRSRPAGSAILGRSGYMDCGCAPLCHGGKSRSSATWLSLSSSSASSRGPRQHQRTTYVAVAGPPRKTRSRGRRKATVMGSGCTGNIEHPCRHRFFTGGHFRLSDTRACRAIGRSASSFRLKRPSLFRQKTDVALTAAHPRLRSTVAAGGSGDGDSVWNTKGMVGLPST